MRFGLGAGSSLAGGVFAAIGASLCCVVPLVLVTIGVGGVWVSSLTALEPLRPVFIVATAVLFVLAYRRLYLAPAACEPGQVCAVPAIQRRQRMLFWVLALLAMVLIAFPWFAATLL
jgi:mercuric ion transport protein